MLGSNGFGAVLSAIWAVILTSFAVIIAVILFCLGCWKLSEILWSKIKRKLTFRNVRCPA
jgi:hypothetical protein